MKCVKHDTYNEDCIICRKILQNAKLFELAFLRTEQKNGTPIFDEISGSSQFKRCVHLSEDEMPGNRRVELNLSHGKRWYECAKGHGPQCLCDGRCSPQCKDFSLQDEPEVTVINHVSMPDQTQYKRHLAFHIYPSSGKTVWRRAIEQLRLRWSIFDGIKAIAVAQGEGLDDIEEVRNAFSGMDADVFAVQNTPELREVTTWQPLWDRILPNASDRDFAFYGHAKGATREVNTGCMTHQWASLLYSLNLDYWPSMHELLKSNAIAGAFKKVGYGFGLHLGRWHFSGTFYWFNLADFKTRYQESKPPNIWFGTESWPGTAYDASEAGCIFGDGVVSELNLYSPHYWGHVLLPRYLEWVKQKRKEEDI